MMRKKNEPYSEAFRKEALNLLASSGKSKTEIENDLGLTHGLLRKWELRYQVNQESNELERSEIESLKAENRRLKRELEIVRQEREILKKTVTIFSKNP